MKSKSLHPVTSELLVFLSLGHASRIVKSACETDFENLQHFISNMQPKVSSYNETQRRLNQQRHQHMNYNRAPSHRRSDSNNDKEVHEATTSKEEEKEEKEEGSPSPDDEDSVVSTTFIDEDGVETTEV